MFVREWCDATVPPLVTKHSADSGESHSIREHDGQFTRRECELILPVLFPRLRVPLFNPNIEISDNADDCHPQD